MLNKFIRWFRARRAAERNYATQYQELLDSGMSELEASSVMLNRRVGVFNDEGTDFRKRTLKLLMKRN